MKNICSQCKENGSTIVEFTVNVPGKFLLVDHALARMNKGAWAVLEVTGDKNPDIYSQVPNNYKIINCK